MVHALWSEYLSWHVLAIGGKISILAMLKTTRVGNVGHQQDSELRSWSSSLSRSAPICAPPRVRNITNVPDALSTTLSLLFLLGWFLHLGMVLADFLAWVVTLVLVELLVAHKAGFELSAGFHLLQVVLRGVVGFVGLGIIVFLLKFQAHGLLPIGRLVRLGQALAEVLIYPRQLCWRLFATLQPSLFGIDLLALCSAGVAAFSIVTILGSGPSITV